MKAHMHNEEMNANTAQCFGHLKRRFAEFAPLSLLICQLQANMLVRATPSKWTVVGSNPVFCFVFWGGFGFVFL